MTSNITVNTSKNILMLHSVSDIYGASKIALITARLLKENMHNVHVILSEEGPLSKQLAEDGIKVTIIRLGVLRKKYLTLPGLLNRAIVLLRARKNLIKIVKKDQIDILYSNTAMVLIGGFVARHCKIKHIWHIHEITQKPYILYKLIGTLLNRNSDKIITVSNEVKKHWSSLVKSSKMITIHNGLDYIPYLESKSTIRQEMDITDEQVLIGMIGRVNLCKGQKYFVEMSSLLSREFPNARFVLVGDAYKGEEYLQEELHQMILNEKLENVITDLGFRSDVANILKGLDIFVLPSILPDSLPTTVLEAMGSGKPVIATERGGALEMVRNFETGVLIPWDDAETAVKRFSYLMTDTKARKKMGKAGEEHALKFFSKKLYEENILKTIQDL